MPFALFGAFILSGRFPQLRGVAFGLVLGFAGYLMTGFLFGDTVGLLLAIIILGWSVVNQHYFKIETRRIGEIVIFSGDTQPKRKEKEPPVIEILPPDD